MPPRRRQAVTQTAEAYNYASAEKLNNPTSETALGMEPEDLADQPIPEMQEEEEPVRHPRLQWNRGKQTDHSRTFGPLYIHDKVSPEQFLKTLTKTNPQRNMWALLNGLPEDASAKPYEYSGHWTNRLIRATAQRAMASLLYKDGMRGKVNLIYMDPPYNKSFRSNFQASADTPETEEDWDDLPNDPVAIKAFRDTYRDGVHSYLDGLYEQLTLGRELLAEDGSFIVQIGAGQCTRSRPFDGRGVRTGEPRSYHPLPDYRQPQHPSAARSRKLAYLVRQGKGFKHNRNIDSSSMSTRAEILEPLTKQERYEDENHMSEATPWKEQS